MMHKQSFMAQKSLDMIEKMMDLNIVDYYIINCAIPSIITIKNVTKLILASLDLRVVYSKICFSWLTEGLHSYDISLTVLFNNTDNYLTNLHNISDWLTEADKWAA